jgi:hypothetical protein
MANSFSSTLLFVIKLYEIYPNARQLFRVQLCTYNVISLEKKIVLLNLRVLASDITKGKLAKHPIFQQSRKNHYEVKLLRGYGCSNRLKEKKALVL